MVVFVGRFRSDDRLSRNCFLIGSSTCYFNRAENSQLEVGLLLADSSVRINEKPDSTIRNGFEGPDADDIFEPNQIPQTQRASPDLLGGISSSFVGGGARPICVTSIVTDEMT